MGLALSWSWIDFDSFHFALEHYVRTSGSGGGGGRWTCRPGGTFLITPRLCAVQGIVDTLSTRSSTWDATRGRSRQTPESSFPYKLVLRRLVLELAF
jgi:hypothetical protein